jgi:hypothetical protein
MSYYGPASQGSAEIINRTNSTRLPQYDYSKHSEHNQVSMDRAGHFHRHNKRLRRTVRIVPWRDERELQAVGKALFSVLELELEHHIPNQDDNDDQQGSPLPPTTTALRPEEAFAMISVWKSRLAAMGGLPHAIESTEALALVYWRDSRRRIQRLTTTSSNGPSVSVSVMELRLAYSAAIIRCINGYADSLQQQRAMAASVSNLCGQMGIPSWLVDTRHEGSHNALPNLEVLRLSASTLLEFMRSEYWFLRCTEWNTSSNNGTPTSAKGMDRRTPTPGEIETLNVAQNDFNSEHNKNDRFPIDFLLEFNVCASDWSNNRDLNSNDNEAKGDKTTPLSTNKQASRRKKKSTSVPQKMIILPYDPLFGEIGTLDSSDDDDSDDANGNCNEGNKLDKPVVNSISGSSVGTSTNRYMLLDISPTKKKKKGKDKKKQQKSTPNIPKKRKGEKSPTDCAKLFVQSVSSLQEGYAVATQYLIWGGVGGAPSGRGVLIPGSEVAFPATPHGATKCWQRYSPLIHVISRTWPGFAACMITHLVDCVLSIEDSSLVYEHNTNQCYRPQDLGEDPTRELFFLSAWIRLFLSQRFVAALDRRLAAKSVSSKNNNPLELPLAQLDHLECLGYPLNSLLDRCRRFNDHSQNSNDSNGNRNYSFPIVSKPGLTKTRRAIIRSLETILGDKKTNNFGYSETTGPLQDVQHDRTQEKKDDTISKIEPEISSGAMSLDEIEKLLSMDNNGNAQKESETKPKSNTVGRNDIFKGSPIELSETTLMGETEPPIRRLAWIRCERWDACAIGILPGYPF